MLVLHKLRRYTTKIHRNKDFTHIRLTILILNNIKKEYSSAKKRNYAFSKIKGCINNIYNYELVATDRHTDDEYEYNFTVNDICLFLCIGPNSSFQPVVTLINGGYAYFNDMHILLFKNLHPKRSDYDMIQNALKILRKYLYLIKI